MEPQKILYVGPHPNVLAVRRDALIEMGHAPTIVQNRHQAILTAGSHFYGIILVCDALDAVSARKLVDDLKIVSPGSAVVYLRDCEEFSETHNSDSLASIVTSLAGARKKPHGSDSRNGHKAARA